MPRRNCPMSGAPELADSYEGRLSRLAQASLQEGLGRAALAEGIWRHRLERHAALHLQRRMRQRGNADDSAVRAQRWLRPGDLHLRQRGAEEEIPAAHSFGRRLVVPGLFRAGRRLRSRVACARARCAKAITTSSMARRPGPRWRNMPTGSSVWCAPIPSVKPQEGISLPADRHEVARHHRQADHRARWRA